MKVVFLEVDTEQEWMIAAIGPAYIASYIRQHGHEAALIRIPIDQNISAIIADIEQLKPDIIALSLTNRQWVRSRKIVKYIRAALNIPVIAGGVFPTFAPETVLNSGLFDYVCIGEGEYAMIDLLSFIQNKTNSFEITIPNIWFCGRNRPVIRSPIQYPDAVPFMARDFLDEKYGVHYMLTQRGCMFRCAYCAAGAFRDLYSKNNGYGTRRSVDNVLTELKQIQENDSLNYVIFIDDVFLSDIKWVDEFCCKYKQEISVDFSINTRTDTVTPYIIELLAEAGCTHINYGVESGSLHVRRQIMNRFISPEIDIKAFQLTKSAGIMATANYIIGLPGETAKDIEKTLTLNYMLEPDDKKVFVFYPFPGTPLFELCLKKGYLPDNYLDLPANHHESILNLPDLTKDDIAMYYKKFTEN